MLTHSLSKNNTHVFIFDYHRNVEENDFMHDFSVKLGTIIDILCVFTAFVISVIIGANEHLIVEPKSCEKMSFHAKKSSSFLKLP